MNLQPVNTLLETELLAALTQLAETVQTMPTANPKPSLLPIFARLDELTRQLPRHADPTLLHYLHKKSYEKARLFLQGRDAENQAGNCRHV
jgi:hypothetical protein